MPSCRSENGGGLKPSAPDQHRCRTSTPELVDLLVGDVEALAIRPLPLEDPAREHLDGPRADAADVEHPRRQAAASVDRSRRRCRGRPGSATPRPGTTLTRT